MSSLSHHQKFIQIHYSSWSSLKICRFSAWFSMWRENLLEIISSTRSWPERIWYTIEQRHVRLLRPAEKASIATSSDPVIATVRSLGVGTTMWDVSTNVSAWQIIRQWFFGIVSKDQNHSKSINLKKLNRNATSRMVTWKNKASMSCVAMSMMMSWLVKKIWNNYGTKGEGASWDRQDFTIPIIRLQHWCRHAWATTRLHTETGAAGAWSFFGGMKYSSSFSSTEAMLHARLIIAHPIPCLPVQLRGFCQQLLA